MPEIATIAAYLVAVVGIGLWTKRREAVGDFLIAGRSAGVLLTTASLAAVAGALVIAAIAEFSFQYGAGGIWGSVGDGAALAVLGLVAGRIRSLAEKHKFLTLTDYLFLRFGDQAGLPGFSAFWPLNSLWAGDSLLRSRPLSIPLPSLSWASSRSYT